MRPRANFVWLRLISPPGRVRVCKIRAASFTPSHGWQNSVGDLSGFLNDLTGNHDPAPECLQPENSSNIFVEAGTTETGPIAGGTELPPGISHWQCCVHPWMRMTINVH